MDASFTCPDCSMSFRSEGLLEKHRRLFCVRTDEEEDKMEEEENEIEKEQNILRARVMELERLKRRKSELRRDREEREKQQLLMTERENARPSSESLWERKSAKLLSLQKTDDRRKPDEKPGEDPPWNRASTASSASVELPPTSALPTPMINSSEQITELMKMETDSYNKKLAQRRQQMEELIVQKRAIDDRLREFEEEKTRPVAMKTELVEQLMTQQDENQTTLMRLQHKSSGNDPHSLIEKKQPDFLLKQINVVRQRYLESGGCNPEILLDIAAMERDALDLLEKHLEVEQVEMQNKEKHRTLNEELEAFETDNRRLEQQLISLHEANTDKLEFQVKDSSEF